MFAVFLALAGRASSQSSAPASQAAPNTPAAVGAYVAAHQRDILREYFELLAIPNLASDTANIRKNAEHIAGS
jgi:hypothetical protein